MATLYIKKGRSSSGGGVLPILSNGDDWMGVNIKTKKNPNVFQHNPQKSHVKFPSLQTFPEKINDISTTKGNFSDDTAVDKHDGWEINLMKPWWIPKKNPFLNQATQKNTYQIFLPKKISNPKKSFNHPGHLKFGVPSWGL